MWQTDGSDCVFAPAPHIGLYRRMEAAASASASAAATAAATAAYKFVAELPTITSANFSSPPGLAFPQCTHTAVLWLRFSLLRLAPRFFVFQVTSCCARARTRQFRRSQ